MTVYKADLIARDRLLNAAVTKARALVRDGQGDEARAVLAVCGEAADVLLEER